MLRIVVWAAVTATLVWNAVRDVFIVLDFVGSETFDGRRIGWGDEVLDLLVIAILCALAALAGRKLYAAVRYR